MPSCVVKGCTNRSSAKSYRQEEWEETMKITFLAFPKCPMKKKLWLNSLGLQNSVLPKCPIVCSLHFRHEDVDRTSLVCVRLRENALPYVKLPEIRKEDNINVCKEISTEDPSTSTSSAVIKGGKRRHLVNTGPHEVSEKVFKIESESQTEHMDASFQTSNKSTEAKVSLVDKYTFVSPKRLFHSPRKQMLRNHIRQLKRRHKLELTALHNKINRMNKKVTNLQTILQSLKKKNLLEEEQLHSLSGISEFNNELFERMLKKITKSLLHVHTVRS